MKNCSSLACVAAVFCREKQVEIELAAILDARAKGKLGREKMKRRGEGKREENSRPGDLTF